MKRRARTLLLLTTLAVMTVGVQIVDACPIAYTLYYKYGKETCRLYNIYEGRCQYICSWEYGPLPT